MNGPAHTPPRLCPKRLHWTPPSFPKITAPRLSGLTCLMAAVIKTIYPCDFQLRPNSVNVCNCLRSPSTKGLVTHPEWDREQDKGLMVTTKVSHAHSLIPSHTIPLISTKKVPQAGWEAANQGHPTSSRTITVRSHAWGLSICPLTLISDWCFNPSQCHSKGWCTDQYHWCRDFC